MDAGICRIEREDDYDDGVFRIGRGYGFLPRRAPLARLPMPFAHVQSLLDELPVWLDQEAGRSGVLGTPGLIETRVAALPDLSGIVSKIVASMPGAPRENPDAARALQAIFRGYSFLASAYLLEPAHHGMTAGGRYGKARNVLPAALARPLVLAANALGIAPWLDYHHAYSLGNFVHRDPSLQGEALWHWRNLDMACRFSGTPDEVGFIMLHVQINHHTPALLGAFQDILRDARRASAAENLAGPWQRLLRALEHINRARREMWTASRPERYNDFRVFIMGITGNEALFGPGVIYEGVEAFGGRRYADHRLAAEPDRRLLRADAATAGFRAPGASFGFRASLARGAVQPARGAASDPRGSACPAAQSGLRPARGLCAQHGARRREHAMSDRMLADMQALSARARPRSGASTGTAGSIRSPSGDPVIDSSFALC